jgi:DNA-binding PadR family transcriptional regulator
MKVSTLGHALLGLLSAQPMTGYDLTAAFDQSLANVWSAQHSQIYPELAKLQAAGLIEQTEAGPRGSKTYAATTAGEAEVRRWLEGHAPDDNVRSERLLRVFFLWMLAPADAVTYLHSEAARHREHVERYERMAEHIPLDRHPAELWGRITLEAGIRYERAMAEWADWAVDEIGAQPRSVATNDAAGIGRAMK